MIKKNNLIKNIIVSLLGTCFLASCNIDVEWNGKFEDDLGKYISTPVTFCENASDTYGQIFNFVIGKKLMASELPDHNDSKIWELKPGYINKGWTLKTEGIDFDLDYADKADGTIEYFVVPRQAVSFYGTWETCKDTPYKIDYQLESLEYDDFFDHKEFETKYGETDTTVSLTEADIKNYEGFTANTPLPSDIIEGRGSTVLTVQYKRNESSLNFHNMADQSGGEFRVMGKYGRDVTLTSWPVNSKSGYRFYGWTLQSNDEVVKDDYDEALALIEKNIPAKFPSDYIDFYPVFGPMVYDLEFKDQFGKTVSGTYDETRQWSYSGTDLLLEAPSGVDSDVAEFEGWYLNNPECDDPSAKLSLSGSDWNLSVDNLIGTDDTLYAKWKYKKIYIDPEKGSDENKGMSPTQAVKTISQAIEYTPEKIMLCSALTDPDDIYNLNGFDTFGVKIQRYSVSGVISFPYIHIKAGTELPEEKRLFNITLDGGADFQQDDSGSYLFTYDDAYSYDEQKTKSRKRNDGVTSSTALIINEGVMFIGDDVILQNNLNTSGEGGAIYNTGTLTLSATSGHEIMIKNNNSAKYGGGIYHRTINNLTLNNVIITDNSAAMPISGTTGGTSGQGGGICINTENLEGNAEITLTNVQILNNRAVASGGGFASTALAGKSRPNITMTNVDIIHNFVANKNNANTGSGGGIYTKWTNVTITNGNIKNNVSGENGGGVTASQGAPLICSNVTIENNTAYGNGGGISTTGGSSGYVDLMDGSTIVNNHLGNSATGKGSAVYMSNSSITITNGYIDYQNDVYFTTKDSNITINDSTPLTVSAYMANDQIIALLTPDSYEEGKAVINNKLTVGRSFAAFFRVSDDGDGKKWQIKQETPASRGELECITADVGSGITNPLETTIDFAIAKNGTLVTATPELKISGEVVSFDWSLVTGYNYEIKYFGASTGIGTTANEDTQLDVSILVPGTYKAVVDGYYDGIYFYKEEEFTIN